MPTFLDVPRSFDLTFAHYEAFARDPLVGLIISEHGFMDSAGSLHTAGSTSHEFSTDEISYITDEISLKDGFAAAAQHVGRTGDDGVELYSSHGYLLGQLSLLLTNVQSDECGSRSIQNRTRFLVEMLQKTCLAVGEGLPISVRLGGSNCALGGSTIAGAAQAAHFLKREGVDLVDLADGTNVYMCRGHREPGWSSDMSTAVRQAIHTPPCLLAAFARPARQSNC